MAQKTFKAPTEEEIKRQKVRALLQQRASLAQGALYSLLQKEGMSKEPEEAARYAVELADAFMSAIYSENKEKEQGAE